MDDLVFAVFLIFTGAWLLGTLMLLTRQSLLVAYILLGILVGPFGFDWLGNSEHIRQISEVGIMFLLFLMGLELHPNKLWPILQKSLLITLVSALGFTAVLGALACALGFSLQNALLIGLSLMFSSTIIGLKLMPTTALHHQHVGKLMISVLLLQDVLAILALISVNLMAKETHWVDQMKPLFFGLPVLCIFTFGIERFLLTRLIARFDRIKEYIFLLSIGWCLGMAQLAVYLQLPHEVGAFLAGVALAEGSISWFIAESLKPLRDFFLVMFFFTVGAGFDYRTFADIAIPVTVLTVVVLLLKPVLFRWLLHHEGESKSVGWEVGWRLGQASEFSLLLSYAAANQLEASFDTASQVIRAVTILTFVISVYVVVMRYPTPVAISDRLRRD